MGSNIVEDSIINTLEDLDSYLASKNNSLNHTYLSRVPENCANKSCIVGIDEAGRGPVLGPMVYGIAFCPTDEAEILKTIGCADSKELTEEKRDRIFEKICLPSNNIGWAVEVISPNIICNNMLSRSKHSLNAVSMDSAIGLIRCIANAGVNIEHIYVDTVGKPEKYQAYLLSIFPNYKITVAKKADSTYPIVSAASICAKVSRDHSLQVWRFSEGLQLTNKDFGSGYPGDPVTKKFLVDYSDPIFGFPQLVRFSWSTAVNVLEKHAHQVEWENSDEVQKPPNNTAITSFFKTVPAKGAIVREKHEFFAERGLSTVINF